MCISKRIIWIISKSQPWRIFFWIFLQSIYQVCRHEKRCQMCVRLFCLFQCSRNQQCLEFRLSKNCETEFLQKESYSFNLIPDSFIKIVILFCLSTIRILIFTKFNNLYIYHLYSFHFPNCIGFVMINTAKLFLYWFTVAVLYDIDQKIRCLISIKNFCVPCKKQVGFLDSGFVKTCDEHKFYGQNLKNMDIVDYITPREFSRFTTWWLHVFPLSIT